MIALRLSWAAVLAASALACDSDTAPDLRRLWSCPASVDRCRITPPPCRKTANASRRALEELTVHGGDCLDLLDRERSAALATPHCKLD